MIGVYFSATQFLSQSQRFTSQVNENALFIHLLVIKRKELLRVWKTVVLQCECLVLHIRVYTVGVIQHSRLFSLSH